MRQLNANELRELVRNGHSLTTAKGEPLDLTKFKPAPKRRALGWFLEQLIELLQRVVLSQAQNTQVTAQLLTKDPAPEVKWVFDIKRNADGITSITATPQTHARKS